MLTKLRGRFCPPDLYTVNPAMTKNWLFGLSLLLFFVTRSAFGAALDPQTLVRMLGCRACHRLGGRGGQLGPDLAEIRQRLSQKELLRILRAGKGQQQEMPSYDYLSETELQQLLEILQQP